MDEKIEKLRLENGFKRRYFSEDIKHYRELFDLSPNPSIICDEDGVIDLNNATLKMFAVSTADAFASAYLHDLAPTIQPNGVTSKKLFEDLVHEADAEGTASIECICKKHNTDETFPVEVVMSLIKLHDCVIHQVSLIDLSHLKHWQNALQPKKEVVALHAQATETSVITTSSSGEVTYMNKAACQLTGWSIFNAVGKSVQEVIRLIDTVSGEPLLLHQYASDSTDQVSRKFPMGALLISNGGLRIKTKGSSNIQRLADGSILGYVITLVEFSGQKVVDNELEWHATHDALTRLPNRTLLADRFKHALFTADRHNKLLAVCMMDIDEFKPVNDKYGHAVGDLLLIEIASRLKQHLRQDDTVARLGGDEFVLLLGNMHNKPEFFQAIQRIRSAIAEPYILEGKRFVISCSIGVTMYPEDDADADTLLRHADQAMFVAKQAGRNRVHWFDIKQDQEVSSSQKLITRVEQALVDKEFELYYQPKVNMRTANVMGMEALIRWVHPEEGMILPLEFLPYIEQHDLITAVGEWVLQTALTQLGEWHCQGYDWSMSVNIAAKHFHVPNFTSRLKRMLREFPNVKPEKLEIEILESVALGDIQHVQTVIEDCRALGVRFALDDFGTGYSSLSYLKRLPADVIKIDQSFIRDILNNKEDLALVQAISSLAVTFEREVVGEGVETVEQGALLMRLGCNVAQGNGIARPMPADDIVAWAEQFVANPKWQIWSKSEWDLKGFPLLVAQYDIQEWLENVIMRIEDATLPREDACLADESKCRFGQWYHADGHQRFSDLDVFKRIDPIHRLLHSVGDEIIHLYINGKVELAQQKCPELYKIKAEMFTMLDELQLKAFSG